MLAKLVKGEVDVESSNLSDEGARRAGRREANLRTLNERIVQGQEQIALQLDSPLTVLCECADPTCDETIELSIDQFESLREHDTRFIVIDGHVLRDVEDIVARGEEWILVEKRGEAAKEARRILE